MITGTDLDHVAVAAARAALCWPGYRTALGGEWVSGGATAGFWCGQLRYANGMKLEVLEPWAVDQNDFLQRFLDQSGPGPHHLTFKVPDLAAALTEAEAAGHTPVGVNLADPDWKEAFLHPKAAHGVVVQLAQSSGEWADSPPDDLPPAGGPMATLLRITHGVASLDGALDLFAGLLGGSRLDAGESPDGHWVELGWPGPGRLRLVQPRPGSPLAAWVAARPGRVHHLAFACADPAAVPGSAPHGDGRYQVPPEANLGTRLVLSRP
ncbi:MAG: VOC family protein [Acidimicrobiales bacterium]|nr:VOC family protein [Acidimicrobiales bacterium]